jgi:hypothetical protein
MTLTRFVTSTAIAAALILPSAAAFAQDSYYIVQDVKTKKCQVMTQKPTGTEYTVVGSDGTVYKTKTEAETALKTVKVCTTS